MFEAVDDLSGIDDRWLLSDTDPEPQQAGAESVDFKLIVRIIDELERPLAVLGREMKSRRKARMIRAPYP